MTIVSCRGAAETHDLVGFHGDLALLSIVARLAAEGYGVALRVATPAVSALCLLRGTCVCLAMLMTAPTSVSTPSLRPARKQR